MNRYALAAVAFACRASTPVAPEIPRRESPPAVVAQPQPAIAGTVRDELGQPLPDAIVIACDRGALAAALVNEYLRAAATGIAEALVSPKQQFRLECARLAVDETGAWQLAHAMKGRSTADPPSLFVAAPGRSFATRAIAAGDTEIVLGPEVPLQLEVTCEGSRCRPWSFWLQAIPHAPGYSPGATLPAEGVFRVWGVGVGRWHIFASVDPNRANEMRADRTIELDASPTTVALPLKRNGTGRSIAGHVRGAVARVRATCGSIVRAAEVGPGGAFVIDDVGAGTCTVEVEDREVDSEQIPGCAPHRQDRASAGATDVELVVCDGAPIEPHE